MARKVILDVDPGIDDAMAISLALADPELEVLAVTATGGNVPPSQATRNVQTIIEQLDPARLPRVGAALPGGRMTADRRHLHGANGLGDAEFKVAELHHRHASDKVICDEVHAAPGAVTIVALGPLTNIAAAFQRDPDLAMMVGHLVISGGAITAPGNVTPSAEFNIHCNPTAARAVFNTPVTKTLVPLDVTNKVLLTFDVLDQLPEESSSWTGALLRKILPFAFRAHRQHLGLEGIYAQDAVAMAAVAHPELFVTTAMSGDVEVSGELTTGATVFDRRTASGARPNMEVGEDVDAAAVLDYIIRGLTAGV